VSLHACMHHTCMRARRASANSDVRHTRTCSLDSGGACQDGQVAAGQQQDC